MDAPGGTGKTFILNALLSAVRSDGHVAIGTAISAVASKFLAFGTGKLLLHTKLIIIDEVSMGHKHIHEAIDKTLRGVRAQRKR